MIDKTVIYLIHCETTKFYKIGITQDIKIRLNGLQNASPFKLSLIHSIDCYYTNRNIEEELGNLFKRYYVRGEWYEFDEGIKNKVIIQMDMIEKEIEGKYRQIEPLAEKCYQYIKQHLRPIKIKVKGGRGLYKTIYELVFSVWKEGRGLKELIKWVYVDYEKREKFLKEFIMTEAIEIE